LQTASQIIFWQPIASPHQEAFLESLARKIDGEVILGVEQSFPAGRRAQGWQQPTHTNVNIVDLSIPANHAALAAHTGPSALHVFSGFFSHPLVWGGFRALAASQARLAIFSEAPEQTLATGWLKQLRGRALAARWARRFAFVLAIGGVGCEFFSRIGFPREKIVPFGYFLDVPPLPAPSSARPQADDVCFVSAGQLIRRKGIDLLVRACAGLPADGWRLDIYGDGPERPALERMVAARGLTERIVFHGVVANADVRRALSAADCGVLPSRFDGWGMLVSESLAAGTPVICTDACGASMLVSADGLDSVVRANRVAPLAAAVSQAVARGRIKTDTRVSINAHAADHASAERAAERFVEVLRRG
jgi:glycosyltransferase involved in cell wall biosynthesis